MTVAVLALQGAFIEHEHVLEELGVKTVELRQAADLDQPYDGLILPGGESTVQGKLLRELKMFDPLKKQIADGMPVLGTCAGLILLGSPEHFGTIPMQVKEMPTDASSAVSILRQNLKISDWFQCRLSAPLM